LAADGPVATECRPAIPRRVNTSARPNATDKEAASPQRQTSVTGTSARRTDVAPAATSVLTAPTGSRAKLGCASRLLGGAARTPRGLLHWMVAPLKIALRTVASAGNARVPVILTRSVPSASSAIPSPEDVSPRRRRAAPPATVAIVEQLRD